VITVDWNGITSCDGRSAVPAPEHRPAREAHHTECRRKRWVIKDSGGKEETVVDNKSLSHTVPRGAAGIANGQPKMLLSLFFEGYPLMNFAVCTALYVFLSYRLFVLTNELKNVVSA
jgi:hypothetical protein